MKKMPLGKLSKRQIESAYKILTELQQVKMFFLQILKLMTDFKSGHAIFPYRCTH